MDDGKEYEPLNFDPKKISSLNDDISTELKNSIAKNEDEK